MNMDDPHKREAFLSEWYRKHPKPTAAQLIELVRMLGKPPVVGPGQMFDPTRVRCACNKDVPCEEALLVNTGHISAVEPVCAPCRVDYEGLARLVCVRCRSVIGWLKPQVDPHGFKIEPGKFYHVGECAVCKKNLPKADIIEMMVYYDEMGIPYPKDFLT